MTKEYRQHHWNDFIASECKRLVECAIAEDQAKVGDLTSAALIPEAATGSAAVVARNAGVVAGLSAMPVLLETVDAKLEWVQLVGDGAAIRSGDTMGVVSGPVRSLLGAERLLLNLLGRLSGVATLTSQYVAAVAGTKASIYDTRKTTLGWRYLEKYAVKLGGGWNHRTGLFDAVLIKDNHLAFGSSGDQWHTFFSPADAVQAAKKFITKFMEHTSPSDPVLIEIEVDNLEQLAEVLPAKPDIVLLDNMPPDWLRRAVRMRNETDSAVQLEASGGVNLQTVHAIAESGVERISVGALTHSAIQLDFGLDWKTGTSLTEPQS